MADEQLSVITSDIDSSKVKMYEDILAIDGALKKIKEATDVIGDSWSGDEAIAFKSSFETFEEEFDKLVGCYKEHANLLGDVSNLYNKTHGEMSSSVSTEDTK